MTDSLKKELSALCGAENTAFDEPLSKHTSFRIGGPADAFVTPENAEDLGKVLAFCAENGLQKEVIGNGTNILAADEGYRGVVIQILRNFGNLRIEGETVHADAGILLSALSSACTEKGLAGFEFASGIPGTLGGAVFMNAGAYGGEMKDVITEARVFEPGMGVYALSLDDLQLGYRTSAIRDTEKVVLGVTLQLHEGDPETSRARVLELKEQRTSKQPLEFPSAGSTFKRPEGYFAGKLIMDAGLKGASVGGAQVSEKHCGFIINRGGATAEDVKELMRKVTETVYDRFGVRLEKEVRFLGEV